MDPTYFTGFLFSLGEISQKSPFVSDFSFWWHCGSISQSPACWISALQLGHTFVHQSFEVSLKNNSNYFMQSFFFQWKTSLKTSGSLIRNECVDLVFQHFSIFFIAMSFSSAAIRRTSLSIGCPCSEIAFHQLTNTYIVFNIATFCEIPESSLDLLCR